MIFYSSAEARTVGAPIVRLAVTAFARVPDPAELAAWVAQFKEGASLEALATGMAGADEFLARHGPAGAPDANYLRALFWAIDGQDLPDQAAAAMLALPGASRASLLLEASMSERAWRHISLVDNLYPDGLPPEDGVAYQFWLEAYPDSDETLKSAARHAATLPAAEICLFLQMPTARPDLAEETVRSLGQQIWPHWQCVVICLDMPPYCLAAAAAMAQRLPNLLIIAAGAGENFPAAINRILPGMQSAMFGCLEAGDILAREALLEAAAVLQAAPDTRLIYTDEDWITGDGRRNAPSLKPDWSPDLALTGDSFGQLSLYQTRAALAEGGFQADAAPYEAYDLALRLAHGAPAGAMHHLPAILFHRGRRKAGRKTLFPAQRAGADEVVLTGVISRHLQRHQPDLSLNERLQGRAYWPVINAALPTPAPRVSIIVPVRDQAALLEHCLEGLLADTDYPDIEIIIVDNDSQESKTLHLLARIQHDNRVRVISHSGKFNWSALNNHAAAAAGGEILLFLNNDIEVIEPQWLRLLAAHIMRPEIGVAGARLIFADGRLQHGGMLLGPVAAAVHALTYSQGEGGYLGQVGLGRDISAVTGACLAIRKTVFEEIGGFYESLAIAWGDVDLCLRVRKAGYRVAWLPQCVLIHHEMATRGRDITLTQQVRHEMERAEARRRSPDALENDPFLNPNLAATMADIRLATPPRRLPPWAATEPNA